MNYKTNSRNMRTIFALVLTVLTARTYAAPMFVNKSDAPWQMYEKVLADALGGVQPPTVLQPLAVAQRVEWDTQSGPYNLFLKQDIGNTIPNFTPLYTRSVDKVSDAYLAFLDKLNSRIIDGAGNVDKRKLARLDDERRTIRHKLATLTSEIERRWQRYVNTVLPAARVARPEWETTNFGGERATLERQLQMADAVYLREVNTAGGDLLEVGRAIAELGSPTAKMALPSQKELIELGPDSWESFYRTYVDGDITTFKNDQAPTTLTIKQGNAESEAFSKAWGASASASWCVFFSASGKTEHEDKSRKWEQDTQEVTISFKNLKPFNILRGSWFKGGLINKFFTRVSNFDPAFFGPSGRLNLIPTTLIIGQGLTIDVKTSKEMGDWVYNRHHTSGGGGFGVGPFHFGGSGSYTSTYEQTHVTKTATGYKVEDVSGRAVILAVVSQRPADLFPKMPQPLFMQLTESDRAGLSQLVDAQMHDAVSAPLDGEGESLLNEKSTLPTGASTFKLDAKPK